jgi:hypothetical protein
MPTSDENFCTNSVLPKIKAKFGADFAENLKCESPEIQNVLLKRRQGKSLGEAINEVFGNVPVKVAEKIMPTIPAAKAKVPEKKIEMQQKPKEVAPTLPVEREKQLPTEKEERKLTPGRETSKIWDALSISERKEFINYIKKEEPNPVISENLDYEIRMHSFNAPMPNYHVETQILFNKYIDDWQKLKQELQPKTPTTIEDKPLPLKQIAPQKKPEKKTYQPVKSKITPKPTGKKQQCGTVNLPQRPCSNGLRKDWKISINTNIFWFFVVILIAVGSLFLVYIILNSLSAGWYQVNKLLIDTSGGANWFAVLTSDKDFTYYLGWVYHWDVVTYNVTIILFSVITPTIIIIFGWFVLFK